ncbi:unnamed protein product [Rhizoctonia solani]|uniref:Uncharacterized protein n=1 Tax=Rhizoctonia solani TaxID=456999 RepID=A0A8H3HRD6_9AGAM|nr:unnamed protein product [Rhizoctonia solani]
MGLIELKDPLDQPLQAVDMKLGVTYSEAKLQRVGMEILRMHMSSDPDDVEYSGMYLYVKKSVSPIPIASWSEERRMWVPRKMADKAHELYPASYFGLTASTRQPAGDMSLDDFEIASVVSTRDSRLSLTQESTRVKKLKDSIFLLSTIAPLNKESNTRLRSDTSSNKHSETSISELIESGFLSKLKELPTDEAYWARVKTDCIKEKIPYEEHHIVNKAGLGEWRKIGETWSDVPDHVQEMILDWDWPGKSNFGNFCRWAVRNHKRGVFD